MEKQARHWEERHYKIVEEYEEMIRSGKQGKEIDI